METRGYDNEKEIKPINFMLVAIEIAASHKLLNHTY